MTTNAIVEFVDANGFVWGDVIEEDALRTEAVTKRPGGEPACYGLLDLVVTAAFTYALYGHIEDV